MFNIIDYRGYVWLLGQKKYTPHQEKLSEIDFNKKATAKKQKRK